MPILFVTCIERDSFFFVLIVVVEVDCLSCAEIVLGQFSCESLLILKLLMAGKIVFEMILTHHFLAISDDLEILRHGYLVRIDLGLRVYH